jgi:hypothetical protein
VRRPDQQILFGALPLRHETGDGDDCAGSGSIVRRPLGESIRRARMWNRSDMADRNVGTVSGQYQGGRGSEAPRTRRLKAPETERRPSDNISALLNQKDASSIGKASPAAASEEVTRIK